MATLRIDRIPVADLVVDPANVRTHPERNLEAIKGSLARFGQQKPIVVGKGGVVVAGNGTLEAARALGWEHLDVVRTSLTGADATAFAIADNRTSELAEWDDEGLSRLLQSLPTLEGTGFDQSDLDALLASLSPAPTALTDPDDVPEPPAAPVTQPGDLWLLGPHRLLCGDARAAQELRRSLPGPVDCVVTDPPYGVGIGAKNRALDAIDRAERRKEDLSGDEGFDEVQALWAASFPALRSVLAPGTPWYCFAPQGPELSLLLLLLLLLLLKEHDLTPRHVLIWAKNRASFSIGRLDYDYQHEPIVYGWIDGAKHRWHAEESQTSLLSYDRPQSSREHATAKPVALLAHLIRNSTRPGDLVFDPLAGSGSTGIAAYGEGRRSAMVEINPVYVDVICRRYQEHTGTVPILEATGEPHDFTERADVA